ncbi:MAG: response regulator transcription factor [Verrucomicrobiota bacterium]|nr:response regulator transcription factor [Verrucomicrobiota bacterium]
MKDKPKILVVEDDPTLTMGLEENLRFAGYEVVTAADGVEGLRLGWDAKPDLIVLDLMLPRLSGYEVCRQLRAAGAPMPIVILTARQEEFDKLHGFESGADDYVTKPFSVKELLARVRAILLRGRLSAGAAKPYEFGHCLLDLDARLLKQRVAAKKSRARAGARGDAEAEWEDVPLTRTEFDLLAYFCANEGKALSRETILNDVWGTEYYGTQRSLDSFVASLRAKIEKEPGRPGHILTIHGVGYKFMKVKT